jgi:hypothetical protein
LPDFRQADADGAETPLKSLDRPLAWPLLSWVHTMSGLRRKLAAIAIAAMLLAGGWPAFVSADPACATMQHKCCEVVAPADCCVVSPAPAHSSTPAEARYEAAPTLVATAVPAAGDTIAPVRPAAAAPQPSPPRSSPPVFVTLYSSLLI